MIDEDAAIDRFEFAQAAGQTPQDALKSAIAAYPNCASLLADYALSVQAAADIEDSDEITAIEARVRTRSEALIDRHFQIPPITGIIATAAALGQTPSQFSASLGLAQSLLTKLDRRLIDVKTIPQAATRKIASALACSVDELRAYLLAQPTLARSASYRAAAPPTIEDASGQVQRESFDKALAAAVRSGEMTKEQAELWQREA